VWFFLVSSVTGVVLTALADLRKEGREGYAFRVRKRAKTMLNPKLFDIRFSNYLILNWLSSASEKEMEHFARLERMLLRVVAGSEQSSLEVSLAKRFKNMTVAEPYILEWILTQPGSDRLMPGEKSEQTPNMSAAAAFAAEVTKGLDEEDGEDSLGPMASTTPSTTQAKLRRKSSELVSGTNEVVNTLALLTVADNRAGAQLPGIMMFNEDALGLILVWCADRAKAAEKELMTAVLNDLKAYEKKTRENMTPWRRFWAKVSNASQLRAVVARDQVVVKLYQERNADVNLQGFSRTMSGRLHFRSSTGSGERSVAPRKKSEVSSGEFSEASCKSPMKQVLLDAEDTPMAKKLQKLAKQLAVQIPCEYVIIIPVKPHIIYVPWVVAGSEETTVNRKNKREKVARRHSSLDPACPVGMCIEKLEIVEVQNMLLEDRFDKKVTDTEKIFSTVCVPILSVRTQSMRHTAPHSPSPQARRQSWAPINKPLNADLEESQADVVAVLKVVNKVDFVRQMAGIPFHEDDSQLAGLFAEYVANIAHDAAREARESKTKSPRMLTTGSSLFADKTRLTE